MRQSTKLAAAVAAALAVCAVPSQAAKFRWGETDISLNNNISFGASWRMEDADNDYLSAGNTNGKGKASSSTADDGNLNYDDGDLYSMQVRGLHDLEVTHGNWGFFGRVKWWYDYVLDEEEVDHGHVPNDYEPDQTLEMGDFQELAQEKGIEALDYYLFYTSDWGEVPVEFRAGKLVLNWGENLFIQNGINVINPFDVTALRRPGTEIREALLPTGLVYANIGATPDLSLEVFYQYEYDRTIVDECGTYWNAGDVFGGGCNKLTVRTTSSDREQVEVGDFIPRAGDDNPSNDGQWGISAKYFVEQLNGTEFGFYYINTHSRTPIFSGINPSENFGLPFILGANPQYFFEYPEDIETYALSFATNVGFWAVSGEVSYRPDFPLQINTTEIAQALALGSFAEWSRVQDRALQAGPGGRVRGYDDVEYTQAQISVIRFFEQVLGADRLNFAAEVGAVWLDDMDDNQRYGRSPVFGVGDFRPIESDRFGTITCTSQLPLGVVPNSNPANCTNDGFTEDFAWGYRIRASLEFNDLIAGANIIPNMAWSHDVDGTSPAPNFVDERQAFSIGLRADYLNIYRAELSYTTFFGADYNELDDRDFLSFSVSAAF
ncbi:MAG: DUF1302 domain-containing protein [Halieaceae bacterium]|nr:DUF1302 domain-containing protein [Halieaceae bacterium]